MGKRNRKIAGSPLTPNTHVRKATKGRMKLQKVLGLKKGSQSKIGK